MTDYESGPSNEILLEKAKKGDKAAFEVFYNRNKRHILNYVYRIVGERGFAEEITQETFVKAYVSLARYRPEGKSLNWVYTIAGNLCKNFLRDRRFEPRVSLDEEVPGKEGIIIQDTIAQDGGIPSDLVISKEQEKLIQERIDQLPFKYRKILVLCDIQGCTYEEAARILKCNVRSVGSRLARARLILAESLKKYFKQR